MIKIFSLDKIIYLINNINQYNPSTNSILIEAKSKNDIELSYNELINKKNVQEIYFLNLDIKKTFEHFSSMFKLIEAAGGLVKNEQNEWLFIFRNGKWDLPKGKVEKKESLKSAAIREVEEECGIKKLKIIKELPNTYHTYFMEEKPILKITYWYEMSCNDDSKLIPQLEEGITDVKWLAKTQLQKVYNNTYDSIKDVLQEIN